MPNRPNNDDHHHFHVGQKVQLGDHNLRDVPKNVTGTILRRRWDRLFNKLMNRTDQFATYIILVGKETYRVFDHNLAAVRDTP